MVTHVFKPVVQRAAFNRIEITGKIRWRYKRHDVRTSLRKKLYQRFSIHFSVKPYQVSQYNKNGSSGFAAVRCAKTQ
jgi:hypothetical protein